MTSQLKTRKAHSNTVALVQSSGMGKSRLIRELARIVPLCYVVCADKSKGCIPAPQMVYRDQIFPSNPEDFGELDKKLAPGAGLTRGFLHIVPRWLNAVRLAAGRRNTSPDDLFKAQSFPKGKLHAPLVDTWLKKHSSYETAGVVLL